MSAPTVLAVSDSDFDLDVQITIDVIPGAVPGCDTSDGCAATCDSSCVSAV